MLGILLNSSFCLWTSTSSVFEWHDVTKYHQDAMAKLEALKVTVNDPPASVVNMLIKSQDELY